jgi:hypothetical protein
MARRSLRPNLNQIRAWVRQGRTDAWIAHQLEVTVQQIDTFKRENELATETGTETGTGTGAADFDDEIDLRAEDDALIAAELDAEAERLEAERLEAEAKAAAEEAERKAAADSDADAGDDDEAPKRSRRGRRGGRGRGRRSAGQPFEGSFDHGEDGYGLWLDPGIVDDPVYAEHWAGHRPVTVTIKEDEIVIARAGESSDDDD